MPHSLEVEQIRRTKSRTIGLRLNGGIKAFNGLSNILAMGIDLYLIHIFFINVKVMIGQRNPN